MSPSKAIDHSAPVPAADNKAGQSKLGQVLARDGRPATGDTGQRRDIQVLVTERPQLPHPGGVGQEREGEHSRVDLSRDQLVLVTPVCGLRRMLPLGSGHRPSLPN